MMMFCVSCVSLCHVLPDCTSHPTATDQETFHSVICSFHKEATAGFVSQGKRGGGTMTIQRKKDSPFLDNLQWYDRKVVVEMVEMKMDEGNG